MQALKRAVISSIVEKNYCRYTIKNIIEDRLNIPAGISKRNSSYFVYLAHRTYFETSRYLKVLLGLKLGAHHEVKASSRFKPKGAFK